MCFVTGIDNPGTGLHRPKNIVRDDEDIDFPPDLPRAARRLPRVDHGASKFPKDRKLLNLGWNIVEISCYDEGLLGAIQDLPKPGSEVVSLWLIELLRRQGSTDCTHRIHLGRTH